VIYSSLLKLKLRVPLCQITTSLHYLIIPKENRKST
jgi:hypothetical protein